MLLDEMADLGILSRQGQKRNSYGLRSAQLAQLLGHRDEIADEIVAIAGARRRWITIRLSPIAAPA